MGPDATALCVDRLTKVYADGTHALDAIELRISAGSFFGLLGPNGAGKTTFIGPVAGLVRAPAGAVGVVTGIWAETFDQHSFVANIVITPLALAGAFFYSARTLSEPWQTLTRFDPIYYLVDATRAGLTGFHESPVWLSLAVTALAAAAAFAAASALLARGWRLKP